MKSSIFLLIACVLSLVLILSCQQEPAETPSDTTSAETTSDTTPAETTSDTTTDETPSTSTPESEQTSTTTETAETETPAASDGKYRPPQGNYAYDFSLKSYSGDRLYEYYLPDSFETVQSDDFGHWKSIEFMRISDEYLPIPEDLEELKKYLDSDLDALLERRITPECPDGKIIHQEYLQKDTTILFAVLDLPGGSNMLVNEEPADTVRGVYIVIQGAYSYVISTQIFAQVIGTPTNYIQQLNQELSSFYEGIKFETDPDVGRDFVAPPPTPDPDLADWIPDMKIPDGLFFPDKGSDNIDPLFGVALMSEGDWILYKGGIRSILPIPKGWSTIETGQKTYIAFIPSGDPEGEAAVMISLGVEMYDNESTTSEEIIDEVLEALKEQGDFPVIKREITDAEKGYIFLKVETDLGTTRYLLVLFSKKPENWGDKFFFTFSVITTYEEDWNQYYPIIVEMVKNWYTYDGIYLGLQLPDTLLE